jgi:hypothetical protein
MQGRHEALNNAKEKLYEEGILLNDPDDPNTTWHKLPPAVKAKALLLLHEATSIDLFTLYKIISGAHLLFLCPVCGFFFFENSRLACADFVTNQKQAHRKNGKTLAARKKHYEVRDAVSSLNYLAVFGTKLLTIYY